MDPNLDTSPQRGTSPKTLQDLQTLAIKKTGIEIEVPDGFESLPFEDKQNWISAGWQHLESLNVPPIDMELKDVVFKDPEMLISASAEPANVETDEPSPQVDVNGEEIPVYSSDLKLISDEQKEVVLEPKTKPAPEPVPVTQAEKIPSWRESEEWKILEDYRKHAVAAELSDRYCLKHKEKNESVEDFRARYKREYHEIKSLVVDKIKGALRKETGWVEGDKIPSEEQAKLDSKINDVLFEELVKKENDAYVAVLREARGETLMSKTLENAKNLLSTKTVQWYLSLSRKQRMALSFGIGSITGLAFGATVAPGMVGVASYLAWRAARVGLSGTAAAVAGEWANKRWSAEELKIAEEKDKEDLKNSNLSLEEKSKGLDDIQKRYKKEKIKMTLKKMGTTIAAGAGTGLLTGLAEHVVMGVGGATRSAFESKGGKTASIAENKLPPRKGFEPMTKPQAQPPEQMPESISETAPLTEKMFSDPSVLKHEVVAGDSAWKILKETLENSEQFKGMTEAQKTYVLSALTNKTLQNPEAYGIGKGGIIHVGDKTDFAKLLENSKEVKSIFDKAKQTITEGSLREKSILANNEKIASWVRVHPHTILNEEKVSEILSGKPKIEIPAEPAPAPAPAAVASTIKPEDREAMHGEITAAKNRLAELENSQKNPNLERSFISDSESAQNVERAFTREIDDIYGRSGLLGFGRTAGINTSEWKEMARLPADRVVQYYTGDSTKSGLPSDVVENLSKSRRHDALIKQVAGLMGQSGGVVKPYERENMEQFIKRLGGYVLKTHLQKAA